MKILKFKEFLKAPDLSTGEVGAIMLNKKYKNVFRKNNM
jgi:hypothetical protein